MKFVQYFVSSSRSVKWQVHAAGNTLVSSTGNTVANFAGNTAVNNAGNKVVNSAGNMVKGLRSVAERAGATKRTVSASKDSHTTERYEKGGGSCGRDDSVHRTLLFQPTPLTMLVNAPGRCFQ